METVGREAAPATINREMDCLRHMWFWVPSIHRQKSDGFRILHGSRNRMYEGFLEHDEFLSVRGAAPDHLKMAMTIAYCTGMRMREIIGVRGLLWEQVMLSEKEGRIQLGRRKRRENRLV